jgi:hypothetical protein
MRRREQRRRYKRWKKLLDKRRGTKASLYLAEGRATSLAGWDAIPGARQRANESRVWLDRKGEFTGAYLTVN